MSLLTLDEVKQFLHIDHTDDDTLLTDMILQVEAEIASYTELVLEATDYDEYVDGTGENYIILRRPLNSVTTITVDDAAYDLTDAKISTEAGILYFPSGVEIPEGKRNVRAVYNAGYSTPPADLKKAALLIITANYLVSQTEIQTSEGETVSDRVRTLWSTAEAILRRYAPCLR